MEDRGGVEETSDWTGIALDTEHALFLLPLYLSRALYASICRIVDCNTVGISDQ